MFRSKNKAKLDRCKYPENILNSPLGPILSPLDIEEKNSKKAFCWILDICTGPVAFFGHKYFFKTLLAAFGTWYYLSEKFKTNLKPCGFNHTDLKFWIRNP